MSKYCSNSPACEEDVCRCESYEEENSKVDLIENNNKPYDIKKC